jgi:hypothetical protein
METFADRVGRFNQQLQLSSTLPEGIRVMNPYREDPDAGRLSELFYQKYFADNAPRHLVLGINPGRFGAARSGVPFTDFKRLEEYCGIDAGGRRAHEPSSEFVYRMIGATGGVKRFYKSFFINSVCPLGFAIKKATGREVNYNYYDDAALLEAVKPFILKSLHQLIGLGCDRRRVFCMGMKNAEHLRLLNQDEQLFDEIVALPHPRFVIQYRRRFIDEEIEKYSGALLPYLQDL